MFDLVFLELLTVNLRVTFMKNLWPLPVSFDVGSAVLLTSVQYVVSACSQHIVTTYCTTADSCVIYKAHGFPRAAE